MATTLLAVSPFFALGALACPISMGAMMWFMARGMGSRRPEPSPPEKGSIEALRREHARLGTRIESLEDEHAEDVSQAEPDLSPAR